MHDNINFADTGERRAERPRKRGNRAKRVVLSILGVTTALAVMGFVGFRAYVSRIDAKLSENLDERVETTLAKPHAAVGGQTGETDSGTVRKTSERKRKFTPVPLPEDMREPFYVLILGIDHDEGRELDTENYGASKSAYRSDTMLLCRIDTQERKVALVSIHRDTCVRLPNGKMGKINAAYSLGGAPAAIEQVSEFADVPISHYAEIDIDGLAEIIDSVGGVDVDLPVPVKDPDYTGIDLPAGRQHLDGRTAALFTRCRHGYDEYGDGDRYRAANQRMVISKLADTLLASDPVTISNTILLAAGHVTTDVTTDEAIALACALVGMDPSTDVTGGMEPTESTYFDDTWYEICDQEAWQKMMTRVDKGLSPYAKGEVDLTDGIAGKVD